jgi:hypothetical protein
MRNIDVVDAVLDDELHGFVSDVLIDRREGSGAEDDACAVVVGTTEGEGRDHR